MNSKTDTTHKGDFTTMADYEEKTKMLINFLNQSKCYASFLTQSINNTMNEKKNGTGIEALLKKEEMKKEEMKKEEVDKQNEAGNEEAVEEAGKQSENTESNDKYPSFFTGQLRDYQIEGVDWLKSLYENGISGILADDMGLGKTVQVIALLCFLIEMDCKGPFLIVAPFSVVSKWVGEFHKFAPELKTLFFHGGAEQRQEHIQAFKKYSIENGKEIYPIVITTYEIYFTEKQFFQKHLWKYVVTEEGHRLKNHNSRLCRTLQSLTSENSLIMMETPLQNNLQELWTLLNFIVPHMFTDMPPCLEEFSKSPKMLKQENENEAVAIMHEILRPFVLRRLKSDVLIALPPKKQVLVNVPMSQLQMDMYTAALNGSIDEYLGLKVNLPKVNGCQTTERRCTRTEKRYNIDMLCLKELTELTNDENGKEHKNVDIKVLQDDEGQECRVFGTTVSPFIQLLKIVQHPYLLQMPVKPGTCDILVSPGLIKKSGKFMMLDILLPKLKARGHKILLFTTLCMALDLLEEYLTMRKFRYVCVDGNTKLDQRCENMKLFNSDPDVFIFLMTTRTGNMGLNLVGADTVILFNSDWNRQIDIHAQDCCHRLGQTKSVVVYRFITSGTFEEKVYEYLMRKRNLEKVIVHNRTFSGRQRDSLHKITLQELKDFLDAKGHRKVVLLSRSAAFTELKIEELLDRSIVPSSTSG